MNTGGGSGGPSPHAGSRARARGERRLRTPGGRGQRGPALGGERRQGAVDPLDPGVAGGERHQVGLGEVAVVVRLLLRAQRRQGAAAGVEVEGLLDHGPPRLDQLALARKLGTGTPFGMLAETWFRQLCVMAPPGINESAVIEVARQQRL